MRRFRVFTWSLVCLAALSCFAYHPVVGVWPPQTEGSELALLVGALSLTGGSITPSLPVNGSALWLRADRNITLNSSNQAVTWGPLAGTITFSPPGGITPPAFTANALNGHPALLFDGTNYLEGASALLITGDLSLYAVARVPSPGNAYQEIFSHAIELDESMPGNGVYSMAVHLNELNFFHEFGAGTNVDLTTTGLPVNSGWSWIGMIRDSSGLNVAFRYNDSSANVGFATNADGGSIGLPYVATYAGNETISAVEVAEIIVYPFVLNSTERIAIECYLAARYAFTISGC